MKPRKPVELAKPEELDATTYRPPLLPRCQDCGYGGFSKPFIKDDRIGIEVCSGVTGSRALNSRDHIRIIPGIRLDCIS